MNVLIIDDSVEICSFLSDLLELHGHNPFVCSNPENVPDILKKEDIDIIIVDFVMPGLYGDEVIRSIRKEVPRKYYIIGMSANHDAEIRIRFKESGADYFLEKPVNFDELDKVIHTWKEFRNTPIDKLIEQRKAIRMQLDGLIVMDSVMGNLIDISTKGARLLVYKDQSQNLDQLDKCEIFLKGGQKFKTQIKMVWENDQTEYGKEVGIRFMDNVPVDGNFSVN